MPDGTRSAAACAEKPLPDALAGPSSIKSHHVSEDRLTAVMRPVTAPARDVSTVRNLTHRLLVIEDNPADALLVDKALNAITNYEISLERAASLEQATASLQSGASFDGIILDLTLPDSTGIETLSHVRARSHGEPIVVLTGLDGASGLREEAERLGAFEFVSKDELSQLLPRSVHWILRHKRDAAQHQQFEQLVSAIPDAVIVTDRAGAIRFVNPAALVLYGKHPNEVLGRPIGFDIRPGEVAEVEIERGREHLACEVRIVECRWSGHPAYLALVRDVTERKRLTEQLLQAQKMEAVGLMAGGIAHDFNNLLLVMLVYAEMMRKDASPDAPNKSDVQEIIDSIERARALTGQLLAFSRRQPTEPTVLNLGEVVSGIHSMLRRTLPANIEIVTIQDESVWPVFADKVQIEQVIMNLAFNAKDAMPSGGRFAIEISNRPLSHGDGELPPGDYVAVSISDDGTGIAPEHVERIFDPFFTTKERGRGTGLGLATCYGIVAQAGGRLTVETELGRGTTFTMLLPRTLRKASVSAGSTASAEGPGGDETILIVEDDNAVIGATAALLRKAGYRVITAANGDEARRMMERPIEHVDLVLSDVVMPQLSGPELKRDLNGRRPDLPVVLMTGYSDYPVVNDGGGTRIADCRAIMKPFRPSELLVAIRETLDGTSNPRLD